MIRHYVWSAARQWGQRLGTALTFVILARILSAQQIGLFSAALAIMALAELINENGTGEAVIRHRDATPGAIKALSLVNIAASIVLSAGFFLFGSRIEALFGAPGLRPIVSALSLVLLLNAFVYIPMAVLRRDMRFARLARIGLGSTVLGSTVGIVAAIVGLGVWSLVAQALVFAVSNVLQMNLGGGARFTATTDFRAARPLFTFGSLILLGNLLNYVSVRAVELALPYHYGPAILASYIIGSRFYFIAAQMVSAVLLEVGLSQMTATGLTPQRFNDLLARALRLGNLIGALVFTGLAAVAQPFCTLLFGQIGQSAWPFLVVTALAGNAFLLNANMSLGMKSVGHVGQVLLTAGAQAVIAACVLLPRWPITPVTRVTLVGALPLCTIPIRAVLLRHATGFEVRRLIGVTADSWIAAAAGLAASWLVAGRLDSRLWPDLALSFIVRGATFLAVACVVWLLFARWRGLRRPIGALRQLFA
ncbi:oligosaccharide flippase family protein [Sphingomonas sp. Mn802worker]|uniref:oligosaccharide flippase family protein n=1 Tax=Sphingomonas sp. Mn802worker TaxID=629773 RepID=UPI000360D2CF|nr:oligosaccharide flippase family protein [Sphingomonas sp. Mn802worker]